MSTELLYLEDTYLYEGTSKIIDSGNGEKGPFLTLDKTIFYPQGGGQPTDQGHIRIDNKDIPVTFVGFSNGIVEHYIPSAYFDETLLDNEIQMIVNPTVRLRNAKYHTGGHLISHVLETMNSKLIPIKGYHFVDGAHVEFVDEMRVGSADMIDEANEIIASDIKNNLKTNASLSNFEEVNEVRPNLAPFIPRDKPTRIVAIGDYKPLPCGGTHIKELSELGDLKITKIKRKKDNIKVSYKIS